MSDSLPLCGLQSTQLLCPWDSLGKNTGVDCHFLLQGIFPTQESNSGLLHCMQILYQLSYRGSFLWLSSTNTDFRELTFEFDPRWIFWGCLRTSELQGRWNAQIHKVVMDSEKVENKLISSEGHQAEHWLCGTSYIDIMIVWLFRNGKAAMYFKGC